MTTSPQPANAHVSTPVADLVVHGARIATLDPTRPYATALAVANGRVLAVGSEAEVLAYRTAATRVVDAGGRTLVPGLNDSHTHLIRGGLSWNLELRWDGVPSLADALELLRRQAERTPAPQWVRVVGGWSEFQFVERRMPTIEELNRAAPDVPVFVLHLYDRALLNRAAVRALGIDRDTPAPPGAVIERDHRSEPTGVLLAKPNAFILYSTLARLPGLALEDQVNSTRLFMRELNRLGITSVIDAGGGFQSYPEHYDVIERLAREDTLTVRIAFNLFTQRRGEELDDFRRWIAVATPGRGPTGTDPTWYRHNGAGEMLVFSAADFEHFVEPRPDLPATMEDELARVVRVLVEHRWPLRLHATYDESIGRFLDVFERVDREVPFDGLRFTLDHAETITPRNIDRVAALGGGIAVQHRMAYQGEHFLARYAAGAAAETPPVRRMLAAGVPVGLGTDATRVASYNPWVALEWLVAGTTVGGTVLTPPERRLDRATALRLLTAGSAWFSGEEAHKGTLVPGALADFAVLSADYFAVPEREIRTLSSLLTVVGGRVVHGAGPFAELAPPLPLASPDWSPVHLARPALARDGAPLAPAAGALTARAHGQHGPACGQVHAAPARASTGGRARPAWPGLDLLWGAGGCSCFAY
jgi:predicted amidohydrolase YtcJ